MSSFDPAVQIVYEDNHLIVVNKYPGQIIQGDKTGDKPVSDYLKDYIKQKYNKPGNVFLGVVHRIDRPASGAVIFARTSKALRRLNEMLKMKEIEKIYWIVTGKKQPTDDGTLENHLWKLEKKNKSFVVSEKKKGAKKAVLYYRHLLSFEGFHLYEVRLKTGRHHQIRVQFAHTGCPVKGDVKYGYPESNPGYNIHLHARKLEFIHPVTRRPVHLTVDPPDDRFWNYFSEKYRTKVY